MRRVVAIAILALVTSGCTIGGLPIVGGQESLFTPGDLSDVPRYPGAEQHTEGPSVPSLLRAQMRDWADVELKRYTTPDPADAVSQWYLEELPKHGWSETLSLGPRLTGGVLLFRKEGTDAVLAILLGEESGETEIIIVRGQEQG